MGNVGKRLAGNQTPKSPRKGKLTRQQIILIAVVVVLAAALAVTLAIRSLFVRPEIPARNDPQNTADKDGDGKPDGPEEIDWGDGIRPRGGDGQRKSEDYWTVLILGRDTGGGGQTDTMLLASYDVTNQKATVMSIPRDTMVNVPWDVKKINSVYNWRGGGEKGIQGVYKEVSQLVGFEPDYQVVVEWEAVGALVEAIGGVYFDVPYEMDYHDPYQDLVIRQAKGYRLLNGDDAMQVIRWRQNDKYSPYGHVKIGDSGRMELQQSFLKAVIKQLMQPANVLNIGKIAKVFQENVETDLSFQNILWFGQQAVTGGLKPDDVTFCTMPWRGVYAWSYSYNQDLDYVVPVAGELLKIVNEQLSPFKEEFTLRDLDIMSVNADGSLRSSTGYVEDTRAAQPRPVDDPEEGDEPELDENGNPIDPETGLPIIVEPGDGENGGDSGTGFPGSGGDPAPNTGTASPPAQNPGSSGSPPAAADPVPETPAEPGPAPEDPAFPEDPGFILIGQDNA